MHSAEGSDAAGKNGPVDAAEASAAAGAACNNAAAEQEPATALPADAASATAAAQQAQADTAAPPQGSADQAGDVAAPVAHSPATGDVDEGTSPSVGASSAPLAPVQDATAAGTPADATEVALPSSANGRGSPRNGTAAHVRPRAVQEAIQTQVEAVVPNPQHCRLGASDSDSAHTSSFAAKALTAGATAAAPRNLKGRFRPRAPTATAAPAPSAVAAVSVESDTTGGAPTAADCSASPGEASPTGTSGGGSTPARTSSDSGTSVQRERSSMSRRVSFGLAEVATFDSDAPPAAEVGTRNTTPVATTDGNTAGRMQPSWMSKASSLPVMPLPWRGDTCLPKGGCRKLDAKVPSLTGRSMVAGLPVTAATANAESSRGKVATPVSYTHLTLPTTPYV